MVPPLHQMSLYVIRCHGNRILILDVYKRQGTARSNKVSVTLGFQELPQLESDYGKVGMQTVITTVGNVCLLYTSRCV